MKIALLAPPYLPVPPIGYGGTERIVHFLAEGLVKKGHDVTLFASRDSKTSAKLVSTFPKAIGNSGEIKNKPLLPLLQYIDCFSRASQFDIIHNHAQYYAMFLAELVSTPVVHTIHGSFAKGEVPEEKRMILMRFKHHNFVSISNSQRNGLPELNWVGTVYNGIDMSEFPFIKKSGDYLLWIGRITQKKGAVEAIGVAKRVGIPLKMAAVIDPIDMPFYEEKVKPLVDGNFIQFLGELHGEEKAKLYGGAMATLYPISWHEPFGLVMAEAMSCGTPVIAFNRGSVGEIVKDGITGFVIEQNSHSESATWRAKNLAERKDFMGADARSFTDAQDDKALVIKKIGIEGLMEAVRRIGEIRREDCRKWVEEKFTIEKMVEGYEKIYQKVARST